MSKYYNLSIYVRNTQVPTQGDLYHQFDLPSTPLVPIDVARMRDIVVQNLVAASQGLALQNRPATDLFFVLMSIDPSASVWTVSDPIQATDSSRIASLS